MEKTNPEIEVASPPQSSGQCIAERGSNEETDPNEFFGHDRRPRYFRSESRHYDNETVAARLNTPHTAGTFIRQQCPSVCDTESLFGIGKPDRLCDSFRFRLPEVLMQIQTPHPHNFLQGAGRTTFSPRPSTASNEWLVFRTLHCRTPSLLQDMERGGAESTVPQYEGWH